MSTGTAIHLPASAAVRLVAVAVGTQGAKEEDSKEGAVATAARSTVANGTPGA